MSNVAQQSKIRYEWYQTAHFICIEIFIKKMTRDDVKIEFQPTTLSVSVKTGPDSMFALELDLENEIIPEESAFDVLFTKVEVKLKKKIQQAWKSLETTVQPVLVKPVKKNWDAIVTEELNGKEVEGDALNALFQTLYKDADEDTRRAMMKSYVESNGTHLSTNWSEVRKGKVETTPPDGMVAKPWNS
jgi:suppressor of G2 allele of SKP1